MVAKKFRPFDSRLQHRAAGSAALTADATVDTITQKEPTRTEYITKIYVESIDVASGDEKYDFWIELSDDNFTTVNATGPMIEMGDAAALRSATDTAAGDEFEMWWTTEVAGTTYRYARLVLDVTGTSPSIGFHAYSTILE